MLRGYWGQLLGSGKNKGALPASELRRGAGRGEGGRGFRGVWLEARLAARAPGPLPSAVEVRPQLRAGLGSLVDS